MAMTTFFALPASVYAAGVAKVQDVKVVKTTSSSVTLKWKKVNGATGYQVYCSIQKSKNYKKAKTIKKGTALKATIKKLESNKRYYFKVRAVNKTKKGKFSKPITIKTKKAETYIITYELNGGEAENAASYTKEDEVIINAPSRFGYTFDGWTGTGLSALTKDLVIPKGSTGARSYEAHWTADEFSISYTLNGGTASNPTSYTIEDEVVIRDPSKAGCTFDGWTGTGLSALTKGLVIPKGSTGAKSYEAHWTADMPTAYSIKYELDGGTASNPTSYTVNDEVRIVAPTRDGYEFVGWTGTDLTEPVKDLVISRGSTGNREYIAHWTANLYTVIFDPNTLAYTGSMGPATFTYDVSEYLPANEFTNDSGKFICWNTKYDGSGVSYNNEQSVKNLVTEGQVTLYAQWASQDNYAIFRNGPFLNAKMKQLAGNSDANYSTTDRNIQSIERSEQPAPEGTTFISVKSIYSPSELEMWFDSGAHAIYYYSPAKYIFLDTDSSYLFSNFASLSFIDFNGFRTDDTTNMASMFSNDISLELLDLHNFNTANVTKMSRMFSGCESIRRLDLSSFNTSKVKNMEKMFDFLPSLEELDVSSFDTTSVTDMSGMFRDCPKLKSVDLSSFDTSEVTDMSEMFGCTRCDKSGFTSITINNVKFNTSKVTTMKRMFYKCSDLKSFDFSGFNTEKVTDMSSMFEHCSSLLSVDLGSFNTGSVTTMNKMFTSCSSLGTLDVSSFNTGKVTDMYYMFRNMYQLTTIYASDGFTTGSVTNGSGMFRGNQNLVGGMNTACDGINNVDYTYARIDGGESLPGYFTGKE